MSGNTFGEIFRVTTFGESHGPALGAVIDGVPAGLKIDMDFIQQELDRRKPGKGPGATARQEADQAELLSGVFEGVSTGTPMAFLIRNTDHRSADYSDIAQLFRPGHADFGYAAKYGIRDYRGGGRASGRETAARVAAGAVAKLLLRELGITLCAGTVEAAGIPCKNFDWNNCRNNGMNAPDMEAAKLMEERIAQLRSEGDSCGGIVECHITGVPAGWGEPVFDKLDALLAHAMLSLGAVKGITFGSGFEAARRTGAVNNADPASSGGITGGLSDGREIVFQLPVKPTPSIAKIQKMQGTDGEYHEAVIRGRHDSCIVPRIVPVVEAMAAIVLADCALRGRSAKM